MNIDLSKATPLSALKWAAILVLSIALGLTIYAGDRIYDHNQELKATITSQKEEINTLKQDLALIRIGQEAMGLGKLLAEGKKEELTNKQREVKDNLRQKEIEIDKTISDPEARTRAKSMARMDSVWEMFCQLRPENAVCQTKTFSGVVK